MINIKKSNFISIPRQEKGIQKIKNKKITQVNCVGLCVQANPGVYDISGDSELMIETVKISPEESFVEIGCGTGVVSISLAKKSKFGVGVDINELAVKNSKENANKHKVVNVDFFLSNVFENVKKKYDVVVCNPPYTKHEVEDNISRMFWDPNDKMKINFFKNVDKYLKKDGRIYFGWANFADIDVNLPIKLAKENNFNLIQTTTKKYTATDGENFNFFVFEFKKIKQ